MRDCRPHHHVFGARFPAVKPCIPVSTRHRRGHSASCWYGAARNICGTGSAHGLIICFDRLPLSDKALQQHCWFRVRATERRAIGRARPEAPTRRHRVVTEWPIILGQWRDGDFGRRRRNRGRSARDQRHLCLDTAAKEIRLMFHRRPSVCPRSRNEGSCAWHNISLEEYR